MASLSERFLRHVSWPHGSYGCWIWTGCVVRVKVKGGGGYGKLGAGAAGGKTLLAHRVAYELFNGPIPPGLEVDHVCHDPALCEGGASCPHRRCVNPVHLTLVTHAENMKHASFANNALATSVRKRAIRYCLRGHEFDEANTYICKRLRRHCRKCSLIRQRKGYVRE